MISTDALQVGFLSTLTIVNETTSFIKTIVLKATIFIKRTFKTTIVFKNDLLAFDFSSPFYNEIIVFQKKENANIPS